MIGSVRLAALGVSMAAAAAGVLAGAVMNASFGGVDTAAAGAPPADSADTASLTSSRVMPDHRVAASDEVITGAMGDLVAGSLDGPVVVVGLGDAAAPGVQTVTADVGAAGATVTPTAVLLDGWIDESLGPLRSGLAVQLSLGRAAGGDDLDSVLARSLAGGGSDAPTVLAALAGAELARVPPPAASDAAAAAPPPAASHVIFVVTPGSDVARTAWTQVIATWQSTVPAMSVVVAEYSASGVKPPATATSADQAGQARPGASTSLVLGIREGPLVSRVSTVDTADSGLGRVSVVRSAARAPQGPVGHYGFLEGAGAAVAPVPTESTGGAGG